MSSTRRSPRVGDAAAARASSRPSTSGPSTPPDVALVVPCHDEAKRLDVDAFVAFARASTPESPCVVVFVDDGSGDDTLAVLREIRDRAPAGAVEILADRANVGKAEAVRRGLRFAIERLRASHVAFWDADLATPLDHVRLFRDVFETRPEIDIVFGARVGLLGRDISRSMTRHYMGRVFATLASWTLSLSVYDTQCGAKMFKVVGGGTSELAVVLSEPFRTRWVFDVEMLARFHALAVADGSAPVRERVYEFPLLRWKDVGGSKVKASDVVKMAWGLLGIRRRYFWSREPWPPPRRDDDSS